MLQSLPVTATRATFSHAPETTREPENLDLSVKPAEQPPPRWILNCPLDLFFVCGGALWLLVIGGYAMQIIYGNLADSWMNVVLFAGALMFADSHNAATIVRLMEEPGLAAKHPYVSVLLPVLMVSVLLGVLLSSPNMLAWSLKLYLVLIAQHVTAQAYGITLIYLRKAQMKLEPHHIMTIKTAFTVMMISGIVRQISYGAPLDYLNVGIPNWSLMPEWINVLVSLVAVIATVVMFVMLRKLARASGQKLHPGAVLVAGTTLMLYTVGPVVGLLALLSPIFFHGTQYIAVTTSNAMRLRTALPAADGAAPGAVPASLLSADNCFYWLKLLAIGSLLYVFIPMLISKLGFSAITALAAMFCTVNFHHFAADAVIWRKRNSEQNNQPINQPTNQLAA